jgi:hypothetical protein
LLHQSRPEGKWKGKGILLIMIREKGERKGGLIDRSLWKRNCCMFNPFLPLVCFSISTQGGRRHPSGKRHGHARHAGAHTPIPRYISPTRAHLFSTLRVEIEENYQILDTKLKL